jgi:3-hydroxyisobutyrate dehydrogenase-like beta-hydroxyacid dehydrogenase
MSSSSSSQHVAFLSLGAMGAHMARNLIAAGFTVTVFNRSPEKTAPLASAGARVAATAADAVVAGGIVVTMLSNDAALEQLTHAFVAKLGAGGLHVSMSTVAPDTSRKLAALAASHGGQFLAAPVFGRPEAAAARKLWVCTSGAASAKSRAQPLLDAMSQGVHDFGEDVGAANVVKLSGNFMLFAAIESMAEAQALAEKNGVDRAAVASFFAATLFNCPVYSGYGSRIATSAFEPAGFNLALALKDANLVRDVAEQSHVTMPLADLVHARLLTSVAKGRSHLDVAGIALVTAEDAGLSPK